MDFTGPGASIYEDAHFDVTRILKGSAPQRFLCTFRVEGGKDKPVKMSEEYIATGDSVSGRFEVSELVLATPADIQKVLQLTGHKTRPQNSTPPPSLRPLQEWRGVTANTAMKMAAGLGGDSLPEAPAILAQATSPTVLWLVGTLLTVAFLLLLRLMMRNRRQRG